MLEGKWGSPLFSFLYSCGADIFGSTRAKFLSFYADFNVKVVFKFLWGLLTSNKQHSFTTSNLCSIFPLPLKNAHGIWHWLSVSSVVVFGVVWVSGKFHQMLKFLCFCVLIQLQASWATQELLTCHTTSESYSECMQCVCIMWFRQCPCFQ